MRADAAAKPLQPYRYRLFHPSTVETLNNDFTACHLPTRSATRKIGIGLDDLLNDAVGRT